MFISCHSRECDLLEFFHHENRYFVAALGDGGKLHSCLKSQLASILQAKIATADTRQEASVIIVDGPALINTLLLRAPNIFDEYAIKDVIHSVEAFVAIHTRTDTVFDIYIANSLKAETWPKSVQSTRCSVTDKAKLPPLLCRLWRDNDNND